MTDRFAGIPEHAERTDSTVVTITDDSAPFPWAGIELFYEGGRTYEYWANTKIDITDAYNAWMEAQPKTHRVTFEWVESE